MIVVEGENGDTRYEPPLGFPEKIGEMENVLDVVEYHEVDSPGAAEGAPSPCTITASLAGQRHELFPGGEGFLQIVGHVFEGPLSEFP